MRVDRFSVEGLHGFVDASLDFFPDLTIIVGRNGSGKTSVLDLMSHLIRLDLEAIGKANFSIATLTLHDNSLGQVIIQATNTPDNKKVCLTLGNGETSEISLDVSPALLRYSADIDARRMSHDVPPAIMKRMEALISERSESIKHLATLKKSIKFTFVRLDRTILAVDSEGVTSYDNGISSKSSRYDSSSSAPKDPIEDVIQVMRRNQLTYRRAADRIQRTASSELFKLHFSPPVMLKSKAPTEKQLRTKLQELKKRVTGSHLIANAPGIEDVIASFFSEFEVLLDQAFPKKDQKKKSGRRTLHEETVEVMIGVKEQQISELLRIFDREQEETAIAYQPIKKYLDMAAKFLNDSGKTLKFSPENLELGFVISKSILDDDIDSLEASTPQKVRSIRELSSGERQVLILLTYLAFLAGKDSIFVVDEPELSLHVEWQRELVGALTMLRPSNCQIILATHSPEITGRAKQHCKILKPSYLPQADS